METTKTGAIQAGSTVTAELTVGRSVGEAAHGYVMALARVREASASSPHDVYIFLAEALMWIAVLSEQVVAVRGDEDVVALVYARERSHHQLASVIYPAAGGWRWRSAAQLPTSSEERNKGLRHRPVYERRLEGKPLIEALERVETMLMRYLPRSS